MTVYLMPIIFLIFNCLISFLIALSALILYNKTTFLRISLISNFSSVFQDKTTFFSKSYTGIGFFLILNKTIYKFIVRFYFKLD